MVSDDVAAIMAINIQSSSTYAILVSIQECNLRCSANYKMVFQSSPQKSMGTSNRALRLDAVSVLAVPLSLRGN